jgi:hypothetical protein
MKNKKPSEIISRGATGEIVAPLNLNLPPDLVRLAQEWGGLSYAQKIADTKKRPVEARLHLLQSLGGVCKNALQVVREFRPLIEVCRDELSQPGRRVPVEGKPSWTEFITTTFGFSARRMQQLLADSNLPRTSPKPPGRPEKTTVTTGPRDDEGTEQVVGLAIKLARRLIEQGLADKFPEATEILDIVDTKAEARPSTSASSGNGASCSSPPERKHVSPLPKPRLAVPEGSPEQARGCDDELQPQPDCHVCGTGVRVCVLHEPQVRALMAKRGIDEVDASDILKEQFARRAEEFSKTT